ncbi:YfhO family protein [Pareuzebyella sediminis]|uniref:YfhO family protein n=1 Tax=Pareuzebyella sediminis TaxID=2607998 RepID=UPI0011ECC896|nr:YfhO family protein [Pareuzebyella sediminis]
MRKGLKAFFVHFFVTVFFVLASLTYFYPVLQGKVIEQSDIIQYTGMAKEQNDFRKRTGDEPYWTNSAFGGMPTYQLGAYYPHDYVKKLDRIIRFLPRPADYLFLYFIGFYILLSCLKVDFRLAVLGALAFGFSTYLIVILGVGHNAKAHALGYVPILLGGIVLVFRGKYLWGFVVTALAMALEIGANHYQMTYYFMLLILVLGVAYLVDAILKRKLKHFFISIGILVAAVVLGIAANATSLLATKQYADWSTRGPSTLTLDPEGNPKENLGGLDKEYITRWSYGVVESLNLFVPRLFGGSSQENLSNNSKTYDFLIDQGISRNQALDFSSNMALYWGDQPTTSGPAYIGAVVFFLFILGLFLVKGKLKWWLSGGFIMSLLLSWGKNFSILTDLMIDYFPLYDKFRAVSSIQVVLELCAPTLAILALAVLFDKSIAKSKKIKGLKLSFYWIMGLGLILFLAKGLFDFSGYHDAMLDRYYGDEIVSLIKLDRKAQYTADLIRSLLYVLLAGLALWFFLKEKLRPNLLVFILGVLIVFDLVGVDRRYVNKDDFVAKRRMAEPFQETAANRAILKDTSVYRVFDQTRGFEGAHTSYFHQAISGYHAAKPSAMQDLFDYHIAKGHMGILNMLNVKYVIQQDEEGASYPLVNSDANGNAWFVRKIIEVKDSDAEIQALENLDTKNEAVLNSEKFDDFDQRDFQVDSTASIVLTDYAPNHLTYSSTNDHLGVAVFSEMYYPYGWNAYIDGQKHSHFKVNYALRALEIPEGSHIVEFKFEPEVVKTGSRITFASSILLGLIVLGGVGFSLYRMRKEGKENE